MTWDYSEVICMGRVWDDGGVTWDFWWRVWGYGDVESMRGTMVEGMGLELCVNESLLAKLLYILL